VKKAIEIFYTFRQALRYAFAWPAAMLGMEGRVFRTARGARIVLYHGICGGNPTRFNNIFLTHKTFEEHLLLYKKYFNVISLDDYYQGRFSTTRFNICISFDDGFANNYTRVLPLLEKYLLPATFFVTGIRDAGYDILWNDFLGMLGKYGPRKLVFRGYSFLKDSRSSYISTELNTSLKEMLRSGGFNLKAEMMQEVYPLVSFREKAEEEYWLQMTPGQLKELSGSSFATVAAHGYYHNDLARVDISQAADELRQSKQYIQTITGKEVTAIAFPYGSYTRDVVDEAKRAGYTQLLAMEFLFPEDHSDPAMRERLTVNPFISARNQMLAIISGKYE
jgi:peptidoglycan/xylan/chitin deacetylase (PgdA/CDA1 family)